MASQLSDKVAIVTGASSGLGEAIAIMFASRGAKVTLGGRDEDRLKSVFDRAVQASGGHSDRFLVVRGDLNEQEVRKDIVAKTVEKFGRLDILVANAGVTSGQSHLSNATEESFDHIMNTNVKSVFFLIQQAAPRLEESKGNIVVVSSMLSSLVGIPNLLYPMSKAAIDHLCRCLALDLAPKGVRVNTVNPSYFPTRIWRIYEGDYTKMREAWQENESTRQPLEQRTVTPEEIAEAVTFLASDAASFITSQHIQVDGGRCLTGPYVFTQKKID